MSFDVPPRGDENFLDTNVGNRTDKLIQDVVIRFFSHHRQSQEGGACARLSHICAQQGRPH